METFDVAQDRDPIRTAGGGNPTVLSPLSPQAVLLYQAPVKAVYAKLGAGGRAELTAKLFHEHIFPQLDPQPGQPADPRIQPRRPRQLSR